MQPSKLPIIGAVIERLRNRSDHESVKLAMASKGDVTKMDGYANMYSCLKRLAAMDGTGVLGKPFRTAWQTHNVLVQERTSFTASFKPGGAESVRLVYASAVAALWHLTTLLCAEAITVVKGPNGNLGMVLNRDGTEGLAKSVFVTRLERFVEASTKYGFDVAVTEGAAMVESAAMRESIGAGIMNFVSNNSKVVVASVAITGLLALLMLARDLAEKIYSLRGTFSRWLELQASFLEMNASQLDASKAVSRAKQEEYAAKFRALADRISTDDSDTERDIGKRIQQSDQELEAEANGGDRGHASASQLL